MNNIITKVNKRKMSSIKGKVKWFNGSKGYGFIERDDKQKDVFVHMSAVKDAGIDYLDEGDVLHLISKMEKKVHQL